MKSTRIRIFACAMAVVLVAVGCGSLEGSGYEAGQDGTTSTVEAAVTTTELPGSTAGTTPQTTTADAATTTTTTTVETTATAVEDEEETAPSPDVARVSPDRERAAIPSFHTEFALPLSEGDRATITVSRDGDFELSDVTSGEPEALYNARTLTLVSDDHNGIVLVRTGVITGGPDWPAPYLERHRWYQSMAARAIEDGSGTFVDVGGSRSIEIHESWEPVHDDGQADLIDRVVAVDVATGLMTKLETTYSLHGTDYSSIGTVKDVVRDEASFTSTKAPEVPKDLDIETVADLGFVPVGSLDEASKLAGFDVPAPGFVPEGFELTQIAYGAKLASYVWGTNVVALTYMNAAWTFTVTFRDSAFPGDPYDPAGDFGHKDIAVKHGVFTLVPSPIGTYAYGTVDGRFVTVDGGIGLAVLEKIVDGLS